MRTADLTDADEELIAAAEAELREHFEPGRHRCGAAVRTAAGSVYTAINLLSDVGVASVHAEPIALGKAVSAGEPTIETSAAVVFADDDESGPIRVVSACGACRQLLADLSPDARIVVTQDGRRQTAPIADLLPARS